MFVHRLIGRLSISMSVPVPVFICLYVCLLSLCSSDDRSRTPIPYVNAAALHFCVHWCVRACVCVRVCVCACACVFVSNSLHMCMISNDFWRHIKELYSIQVQNIAYVCPYKECVIVLDVMSYKLKCGHSIG